MANEYDNHERIWLEPSEDVDASIGRQWCKDNQWGNDGVEYVRADLVPAPAEQMIGRERLSRGYETVAEARFGGLPDILRDTTEGMASLASVDMELWDRHSNACLNAATRIELLETALFDLMTWFPERPSPPEWRIRAGERGADDAVAAARAALAATSEGGE